MRIDYRPGYPVYFSRRDNTVVIPLCGGDKKNQSKDLAFAPRSRPTSESARWRTISRTR